MIDDGLNYKIVNGRIVWPEKDKPMTDPTADAAKLLPSGCSVPGCPATGDGKPYAGVPTCMQGYAGDPAAYENYIRGCILRANTRPQSEPAQGEPDYAVLAHECFMPNIPVEKQMQIFGEQMYRLGAASRPKVEDVIDWHANWERVQKHLQYKVAQREAAEARAAKAEAELAKAYDVIAHTLTSAACFWGDIEVVTAAHMSHAARLQQKDSTSS